MEMETPLFVPNRLSEVLKGIAEWMSTLDLVHRINNPWTESHISAILDYVLKLEAINPYFCPDFRCINKFWRLRFEPQNSENFMAMVANFMLELQGLFQVPRLQHCSSDKNAHVAAFISFLLQLLHHKNEFIVSWEDKISCLKKELRFLVTILGDTPFQATDDKEVDKLFAEFEAVANEAGSLVRSFIFTTQELFQSRGTDKALSVLLEHIELLKPDIIEFSDSLPDNVKPKTCAVESSFIVHSVLYDLENLMNREDDQIVNVKDQIKVLHEGLALSQSLLKDTKLEINEFKELAMRTRDVAYEVEYLMNSFLVGYAPIWYLTIRLPHLIHKIEVIRTELQEIKKKYEIGALLVSKDFRAQLSLQPKGNPDANEIIVGFEDEETNILDKLMGGEKGLQIISIVGMPGLGKTTLAKKLYNHRSIEDRFDKCSWCVVSQTYHRKSLLIDILVGLDPKIDKVTISNMQEESLFERIYKSLKGRRYLVVIDDIWDLNMWEDCRRYFPDDGNGSRILCTTRNKDVVPPLSIIYALPSLSNDKCWELFENKVFGHTPCPSHLIGIGKEIAANCNGLPLAVVVIAGILSAMDKEKSTSRNVGRSLASYILSDQNNAVMQILELSYKHLPEHLKPCFLYFGVFSEDEEIPINRLKQLWIAEGFIRREENKSLESVAEEYLVELINKSLLIVAKRRSSGGAKTCVVHDLIHELCLKIAEEENFSKAINSGSAMYEKHHRLYFPKNACHGAHSRPFGFHVRSMFCRLRGSSILCIGNMKLLRLFEWPDGSLYHEDGNELPINLRYLAFSNAYLQISTKSIGHLVNLEFLIVTEGTVLLSSIIQKMVKLRCIRAYEVVFEQDYYWNSSQTDNMEFLSTVIIKSPKDEEMLKCTPHLLKLKCKFKPSSEKEEEYRFPDLRFLTQLESLNVETYNYWGYLSMLAPINLPSNIKKLTLSDLYLPWEKMSVIGELPNLQVLKLRRDAFEGDVWETVDGEFLQLIFLQLTGLYIYQWNVASSEHFPKLQQLVLNDCYRLQEIPRELGEIATLQLIEVYWCGKGVVESAKEIQQEQLDMGNEELKFIIKSLRY